METAVVCPRCGVCDEGHFVVVNGAEGEPGTAFEYNGFLFARLTAVVDAVSTKGLNRAIEEDILDPLGMIPETVAVRQAGVAAAVGSQQDVG